MLSAENAEKSVGSRQESRVAAVDFETALPYACGHDFSIGKGPMEASEPRGADPVEVVPFFCGETPMDHTDFAGCDHALGGVCSFVAPAIVIER